MTSTDIVQQGQTTALSIQPGQTEFNEAQMAALQQLGLRGASRADAAVFFHQAVRTGLDPFARQIYMIERKGKQTIQTGIDGFRLVARRAVQASGEAFGYEDTVWCGTDGQWTDVWLKKEPPAAAKVTVIRNGQRFPAVALFEEYAGRKGDGSLTQMWQTKGALMLAKCAEALALRKAFPQDLSGLYTSDEMQQAGNPAPQPAPAVTGAPRAARQDAAGQTLAQHRQAAQDRAQAAEAQPAPAGDSITPEDWRTVQAQLTEMGYTDGTARLGAIVDLLGRTVDHPRQITAEEGRTLLDTLSAMPAAAAEPEGPVDGEILEDDEVVAEAMTPVN